MDASQDQIEQTTQNSRRGGRGERRALRTKPNHAMLGHLQGKR